MPFKTLDRRMAVAAFFVGAGAVMIAISLGLAAGEAPSSTAYQQQIAYLVGIPLIGILILSRDRLSRAVWTLIALAAIALFLWSAYLAAWQTGVALGLWVDGRICASNGTDIDMSGLVTTLDGSARPCGLYMADLLGLPLPFLNMVVASSVAGMIGAGLLRRMTRGLHRVRG